MYGKKGSADWNLVDSEMAGLGLDFIRFYPISLKEDQQWLT
jgi:hypothetical protein